MFITSTTIQGFVKIFIATKTVQFQGFKESLLRGLVLDKSLQGSGSGKVSSEVGWGVFQLFSVVQKNPHSNHNCPVSIVQEKILLRLVKHLHSHQHCIILRVLEHSL